jgi:DNA-binding response OmpR family regulator
MKVLIADDDKISRKLVEGLIQKWGYEAIPAAEGNQAWEAIAGDEDLHLGIIDWIMPGMDGIEICRRVRKEIQEKPFYIILLTSKDRKEDVIRGLNAGADDYVSKPFEGEELRARLRVGVRVVQLQLELQRRVQELEEALSRVRKLEGLLPICSYCKRVRKDEDYWEQVELYVAEHSNARFTHSICPDCYKKIMKEELGEEMDPETVDPSED